MSFDNLNEVTEINSNELSLIPNGGHIPLSKPGKRKKKIGELMTN